MVGVGGAELEVEAALHVGEGGVGDGERGQDVVHRRVVPRPPPARIRHRHLYVCLLYLLGFLLPALRAPLDFESEGKGRRRLQWSVPST